MREWRFRIVTQDESDMKNFPYILGRYLGRKQKRLSRGASPERQLKFLALARIVSPTVG